jgi:phosphotransferase system enzyme I (PtsI)
MMLEDKVLTEETIESIRRNRWNAEGALEDVAERYESEFSSIDSAYLRDRGKDIRQVLRHIQRKLMGVRSPVTPKKGSPVVLVAHELSPADLLRLDRTHVHGVITEIGAQTSHTAIIADGLEIPAVLGAHGITSRLRQLRKTYSARQQALGRLRDLPCETRNGINITLRANIGSVLEVDTALTHGAKGVGLYRTEYLFVNRNDLPGEEEHLDVYRQVLEGMRPETVVFRTFDLGGDVAAQPLDKLEDVNPVLGLRAIRFALAQKDVLRAQLRALLRASALGPLRILHPFISGLEEVRSVNSLLKEVAAELADDGTGVEGTPPVGIMVETPAAALMADVLAREVDFFTIGTNDLVQYTLAADRGNERVSYLYDPLHPAVLRLISGVVRAARESGIDVSVCGEMAADPVSATLLVGMGVRELSMNPHAVPKIKEVLRSITTVQAEAWAEKAMTIPSTEEVHEWAKKNLIFETPSETQVVMGQAG